MSPINSCRIKYRYPLRMALGVQRRAQGSRRSPLQHQPCLARFTRDHFNDSRHVIGAGGHIGIHRPVLVRAAVAFAIEAPGVIPQARKGSGQRGGGIGALGGRSDFRDSVEDLQRSALRHRRPLIRSGRPVQRLQQTFKLRDALASYRQLLVISYHGVISTIPHFVPSRFVCHVSRNCRITSSGSILSRTQNTLAPKRACASG